MKPEKGLLAKREKNEKTKNKNGEVHRPHHGLRVQADIRKGHEQGSAHIAIFEKVFEIAEYSNLSKEEKEMYNASVKQKWDEQSRWETAIMEGEERARKKAEKEKIRFALNFKKSGVSTEIIAKNLGLSVEDIERL